MFEIFLRLILWTCSSMGHRVLVGSVRRFKLLNLFNDKNYLFSHFALEGNSDENRRSMLCQGWWLVIINNHVRNIATKIEKSENWKFRILNNNFINFSFLWIKWNFEPTNLLTLNTFHSTLVIEYLEWRFFNTVFAQEYGVKVVTWPEGSRLGGKQWLIWLRWRALAVCSWASIGSRKQFNSSRLVKFRE